MFSQTVEYALRAIVTLAQHPGQPRTAQKISEVTDVPAPYLSKLMQLLVRGDLVNSRRGLHGGFVLAKPAEELTVWDVIDVVEPLKRIHTCPLKLGTHKENLCPLHRRMDDAIRMVEEVFRGATISTLLNEEGSVTPLCDTTNPGTVSLNVNLPKSK